MREETADGRRYTQIEKKILDCIFNLRVSAFICGSKVFCIEIIMPTADAEIEELASKEYKWGFISDIEADSAPMGLNVEIVRFISAKKKEPQWLLDFRLKAYRHWLTMEEPHAWPMIKYPKIDYQQTIYYSAPK